MYWIYSEFWRRHREKHRAQRDGALTETATGPRSRSRKFFWWFIIIQLVPLVGILVIPSIPTVWVLIVLVNTCVFCFNLAIYHGRGTDEDAAANRLMFFIISAIFGLMALTWAVRLAIAIYQTGSLGFGAVTSGILAPVPF